ncbi:MAG: hypothetical protein GY794_26245 [bacterium]|nr:hypothetical protein [bacterium]
MAVPTNPVNRLRLMVVVSFVWALGVMAWPALAGPSVASSGGSSSPKGKVHIKRSKQIDFRRSSYHVMTDGGGYRWDLQYYGAIYRGTDYAYYTGAMYLRINGTNFQAPNRIGWVNKAGDELELGPWQNRGLNIYRRIKVYKDQPMARWLEIFENPTSAPITVLAQLFSSQNHGIAQTLTSSGGTSFGSKDFAFMTRNGRANSPATLHVVTSKSAKLRPSVRVQGNQIYVTYSLTIPPRKTVVICHFESQNRDAAAHQRLMKKFPTRKLLRDLPGSLRAMIVNMKAGGGIGGVELNRSDTSDTVLLKSGDPIFGSVGNTGFRIKTLLGEIKIPGDRIIGMGAGKSGNTRFVLADGQIVSGQLIDKTLQFDLGEDGGQLNIPFEKISQWSYRVTAKRPNDDGDFKGAYVVLRTGDRLRFDPEPLKVKLLTRHGMVPLETSQLLELTMDNPGNAVHRAVFLNGSRLGGFIEPETFKLKLTMGKTVELSRDIILEMRFAEDEKPDTTLTRVELTNGDELYGELTGGKFKLTTDYGQLAVAPASVKKITFRPEDLWRTIVSKWDSTILKGRLGKSQIRFAISPKTVLNIHAGQFVSINCPLPLPPQTARVEIEKIVAQLGAESYEDRQKASEKLLKMGKNIIPILRKHLANGDPEVRQRIEDILEKSGASGSSQPSPTIRNHMMERIRN